MKSPMVSVIMPFYNGASFLREAVDSILNQDFTDFELILINDGSTDSAGDIAKSYSDPRIRYIEKTNSGVADSLNYGITLATGQYIWRHDADDRSLPEKLGRQVRFLETHPEFALCSTQIAFMTERGRIAWNYRRPNSMSFSGHPWIEVTREQFNPYSPITHATVLMRIDVMKSLNGYRTGFKTGEDIDLWLRLLLNHRAAVLNNCDYFVRLSKTSATQVHGWKNEFFRNLAFKYYDQKKLDGIDDLEAGNDILLPDNPIGTHSAVRLPRGKQFRSDLLDYSYPLHLDAKDYSASWEMIKHSIRDGWQLGKTWKKIMYPLAGKNLVQGMVKIKHKLKGAARKRH